MNKIKVVQIVPLLSPGGAERVAVHITRGLNRRRYEPIVISFSGRVGCDLDHMLEDAGIEARYLGKHPGFDYRVYSRLDSALKEYAPDVIHTHLHVLRYALPSMLLMKRVAMVHTVHNLAEREIIFMQIPRRRGKCGGQRKDSGIPMFFLCAWRDSRRRKTTRCC